MLSRSSRRNRRNGSEHTGRRSGTETRSNELGPARARLRPKSVTSRTPNTHCDQVSQKDAWSLSASAAAIDGKVNPVSTAAEGQIVQLTLINGEGAEHDIVFPDQNAKSPRVTGKGASTTIAFRAAKAGDFFYFCSVPGHPARRNAGPVPRHALPAPQTLVEADISR